MHSGIISDKLFWMCRFHVILIPPWDSYIYMETKIYFNTDVLNACVKDLYSDSSLASILKHIYDGHGYFPICMI